MSVGKESNFGHNLPRKCLLPRAFMPYSIEFYRGSIGFILGLYRDNGKENGNYYIMIGGSGQSAGR